MKKLISLILSVCVLFTLSCFTNLTAAAEDDPYMLEYAMLTEPTQEELLEDEIYEQLKSTLPGDYLIDIQVFYESKEAIEEGLFNSKESEYFGFLLSEVDAEFAETPYVFTMDENGNTIVQEFVPYEDVWGKVLTNAAIGGGVILICVTVAALTAATGPLAAPAVHLIFAAAAKTSAVFALKSTAIMAIEGAVTTFAETGDVEESLKNAAVEGSEGLKWGAIGGAILGGAAQTINLKKLSRATTMTMNEVAKIKATTNFSDTTIRNIHSVEEFDVYQKANLSEIDLGEKKLLLPKDMNWDFVDPTTGMTNRQLVNAGYNPVDSRGIKYEWHHIGQKTNSPLALLTREQHDADCLHFKTVSEVRPGHNNTAWNNDKKSFMSLLAIMLNAIK